MRDYELTYLTPANLSEEELKSLREEIGSFLREGGGFAECKNPMKRRLGYLIKKEGVVYSGTCNFNLLPEKLENFEKKIKAKNQILRYLIAAKKKPSVKKGLPISVKQLPELEILDKTQQNKQFRKKTEKPKEEKVELKEIEKKLDEILGE